VKEFYNVRRALISVSDKKGIVEFSRALAELKVEIVSTGGTSQLLREANIPVREVSEVTNFPEIMDGRVKTLHPKIHGGILGKRDTHSSIAEQHGIHWFDLVVVNLYPFAKTIANPAATFDDAIENIDIGGPTMIRSAAKNMDWVGVVVDPNDYGMILDEIHLIKGLSFETRKKLATKAFEHTAQYDAIICQYLQKMHLEQLQKAELSKLFPENIKLELQKSLDLRYGENPHQKAAAYQFTNEKSGILSAKQHQGKQLSYNNIADADAALTCVQEFSEPACVIVKHANPCGAATGKTIDEAFERAYNADAQSAFGGIIALNQPCTKKIADFLSTIFVEVLIAPAFENGALEIFSKKENLRILESNQLLNAESKDTEFKFINGGLLVQTHDNKNLTANDLKVVTQLKPTPKELESLLFAWRVLKHIKSNAILIAKDNATVGIGAGQVSRIDAVDIALKKSANLENTVLASDAFFPFRDSIDRLANTGIKAIIQPGGSVRDEEVIKACNEQGIAMVFTGIRCFKH